MATTRSSRNSAWPARVARLPDPLDAEIISLMLGGTDHYAFTYAYNTRYGSSLSVPSRKALPPLLATKLLPMAAAVNRLAIRTEGGSHDLTLAEWDGGEPWKLWLAVRQDDRDQWNITGTLRRGAQSMPLDKPLLLLECGFLVTRNKVARFDPAGAFPWVAQLIKLKRIPFPDRERDKVLANLLDTPGLPPLELDEALRFEERRAKPKLCLRIVQKRDWNGDFFEARLLLDYGRGWMVDKSGGGIWLPEERLFVVRDADAESAAPGTFAGVGSEAGADGAWRMPVKAMPRTARELIQAGWHVEAEGKAFRRPGETRVEVRSGIDWFELHGKVDYGGATANLPQLLGALRRGDNMVRLGDGSFGLAAGGMAQEVRPPGRAGVHRTGPPAFPPEPGGTARRPAGGAARRRRATRCSSARASELRTFTGFDAAAAAGGIPGPVCAITSAKASAGCTSCAVRLRRLPGGRHGPGQDGPGAGVAGSAPRAARRRGEPAAVAGRGAAVAGVQLEAGGGPLHPEAARARPHRHRTREPAPNFDDYDLVLTTYGTLRRDIVTSRTSSSIT